MKKNRIFFQILAVLTVTVSFFACFNDFDEKGKDHIPIEGDAIYYIINYGNYGGTKSEISTFNPYSKKITNTAYKNANDIELNSNVQSATIFQGKMYLMSNNGDKIDVLDAKTLKVVSNPIFENITKPRYFVAKDSNTAYISCWGEVNDWTKLEHSYIAKLNLKTKTVKKIPLTAGPEGIIIIKNKLYIALSAINKIAVMDLDTEVFSFIDVPAIAQHFVKTYNSKLYASIVSKYTTPFSKDSLGIVEIDTKTQNIIDKIQVPGISNNGEISLEGNDLYLIAREQYPGTKSEIYKINTETNDISASPVITGNSFTDIAVDRVVGSIFVLKSPSATETGKILSFNILNNTFQSETETGIYPQQIVRQE